MNTVKANIPKHIKQHYRLKEIKMQDLFKLTVTPQEVVSKSTDFGIKAIDFTNAVFKEQLKFFNDVTDKFFYTYTTQVAEAANKGAEYAKETLGKVEVATIFGNSAKN